MIMFITLKNVEFVAVKDEHSQEFVDKRFFATSDQIEICRVLQFTNYLRTLSNLSGYTF